MADQAQDLQTEATEDKTIVTNVVNTETTDNSTAKTGSEGVSDNVTDKTIDKNVEGDKTTEASTEKPVITEPVVVVPKTLDEILKDQGMNELEIESYKEFKTTQEAQKKEKEKPYSESEAYAQILEFGAKNKLITKDEAVAAETIKAAKNEDLLFPEFKKGYKPTDTELTPDEIAEETKLAFEEEYGINATNEKLKKAGQELMAKEADELRKPLLEKVEKAASAFLANALGNQHRTAVDEFNKNPISITLKVNDKDVIVNYQPKISFDEVKKYLTETESGREVNKMLANLYAVNPSEADKAFGEVITNISRETNQAELDAAKVKAIYEVLEADFKAKAIGATAPFNSKEQVAQHQADGVDALKQYQEYKKNRV